MLLTATFRYPAKRSSSMFGVFGRPAIKLQGDISHHESTGHWRFRLYLWISDPGAAGQRIRGGRTRQLQQVWAAAKVVRFSPTLQAGGGRRKERFVDEGASLRLRPLHRGGRHDWR